MHVPSAAILENYLPVFVWLRAMLQRHVQPPVSESEWVAALSRVRGDAWRRYPVDLSRRESLSAGNLAQGWRMLVEIFVVDDQQSTTARFALARRGTAASVNDGVSKMTSGGDFSDKSQMHGSGNQGAAGKSRRVNDE